MIIYRENFIESTKKKLLELIGEFNRVSGY